MRQPEIIIHRVNEVARLASIPQEFGVEIDLRAQGSQIILKHDPFKGGELFKDWLDSYDHGILVLNIKEAGIEDEAIQLVESRGIKRFFLLDVEFPYLYRACRAGESRIAIRYSEDESIETVENYRGMSGWVWIDTNTRLPLDDAIVRRLSGFQTCLVCPERWGRPHDIIVYRKRMNQLGFIPDAVMTSLDLVGEWINPKTLR